MVSLLLRSVYQFLARLWRDHAPRRLVKLLTALSILSHLGTLRFRDRRCLAHLLHDFRACRRARIESRRIIAAVAGSCGGALLGLLASALFEQPHGQVLRRVADQVELSQDELDLLNQLAGAR